MQELEELGPWTDEQIIKGYRSFHVDLSLLRTNAPQIHRGTVQHQRIQTEDGLFNNHEGSIHQLQPTDEPFQMPAVFPTGPFPDFLAYSQAQLEQRVEELLEELAGSQETTQQYLIATAHSKNTRERLGLPEIPLEANYRLLCTKEHTPGVHSSYAYVSQHKSLTDIHKEDYILQSTNILWRGSPKFWVFIAPRDTTKFEACLFEHKLGARARPPKCSQFIRHLGETPGLGLLKEWGVNYSIFIQNPGVGVNTDYNTYHFVLNSGANLAEATNWSDDNWRPPPLYQPCSKSCGSRQNVNMTMKGMMIGIHRPLEVLDPDDFGAIPAHGDNSGDCKSNDTDESTVGRDLQSTGEGECASDSSTCISESDQEDSQVIMATLTKLHPGSSEIPGISSISAPLLQKEQTSRPMRTQNNDNGMKQVYAEQTNFSNDISHSATEIGDTGPCPQEEVVKKIRKLVQVATRNYEHFVWPSGERDHSEESIEHHLARFDPTLASMASWLNDQVVLEVLRQLTSSVDNVYVINPIVIGHAFRKNDLEYIKLSKVIAGTILAPYSDGSHWYLLAVDIENRTITMFEQSCIKVAEFLGKLINHHFTQDVSWTIKQTPQIFPTDGVNCGVFLLATAESFLMQTRPKIRNPFHLRLHFLQILVEPLQRRIVAFERVQGPTKRKNNFNNELLLVPAKRPGIFYVHSDTLMRQDAPSVDITKLVFEIGSPEVFADLLLLRSPVSARTGSDIKIAMDMYTAGQTDTTTGKMKKRIAGRYIHIRYEGLCTSYRRELHDAKLWRRKSRRNNPSCSSMGQVGQGADTLAIEELLREWQGSDIDKSGSRIVNPLRKALREARRIGRQAEYVYRQCEDRSVDMLVPREQMDTYPLLVLHLSGLADCCRFYEFNAAQLQELVTSLKKERPRLWEALPGMTLGLEALFRGDKDRLLLDDLTMDEILQESLDSNKLIQSLRIVPISSTNKPLHLSGQDGGGGGDVTMGTTRIREGVGTRSHVYAEYGQ